MSDDDGFLSDPDTEDAPPKRENSTIKQMRETLEAKETRLKELEERSSRYESTFLESAGLTEKQANALRAAGYEASPQGIESFRSEVLGVEAAPEPVQEESAEAVQEDTVEEPLTIEAGPTRTTGTVGGKREVTSRELLELYETDPAKADKLLREGRVVRDNFNPGGPAF